MKRALWLGFPLLVVVCASAVAQNGVDAGDATVRRQSAEIRATADKLISSGIPDDVAKGTVLLEKALELEQMQSSAEKLALEREKLKRDLEESRQSHWKDTLVTVIPLLSTIILAGTLIFQIAQARAERNEKRLEAAEEDKRKAEERSQAREQSEAEARQKEKLRFMDALRDLWASEKVSTAAALINTFREEPYRSWVMNTALTILLSRKTLDEFTAVYMDVMNPLTYDDLPRMSQLCKEVDQLYFDIATPVWNEATQSPDVDKLSPEDRERFELHSSQQSFLSQKLAGLLHKPAPSGATVDLSGLCLRSMELSGVDLGAVNISETNWSFVNVDECDMSQITEFSDCVVRWTAWWHASRISNLLLEYLAKNYPYIPGQQYNTKSAVNPEEYAANVARLKASG